MDLKNNELGWNKPNENNGSYDDSAIKENIKQISSQLEHNTDDITKIVNKVYEINVLNPPIETGLKAYVFNGDITENTNRIQAIFDYISKTELSYKNEGMSIYTGYNYKVKFPTGVYRFDSQINCKGRYLTIEGERAIIQTTHTDKTFYFSGGAGWNLTIKGFTFDRVYDAIWFDYYNLEMGSTRIYDCWFIDIENEAIHIDKQSQIGVVRDCKFHKCGYVLYHKSVDRMIFEDNWISEKPRWKNKDASIIAKGMRLIYRNNLWVPYPTESGVMEPACINAYNTVKVIDCHFGGEPGSKAVINVMEECQVSNSTSTSFLPVIEVSNCDVLYNVRDYTVIRLFALPANLIVRGNLGFADNTVIAKWGEGVDSATIIEASKLYCQIDISLNNGHQVKNGVLDKIPSELNQFLYDFGKFSRKNSKVTASKTSDKTYTINTNIMKKESLTKTYLLKATAIPTSGHGMYFANICCIVSFNCAYTGGAVKTNLFVSEIYNHIGGTSNLDRCTYNLVFEETGTTQLVTKGDANDTDKVNLIFTWDSPYYSSLKLEIKELFDGTLGI